MDGNLKIQLVTEIAVGSVMLSGGHIQAGFMRVLNVNRSLGLARAASWMTSVFVFCCVIMHFVQPDLNPIDEPVSYYMNGRLGWILGLGSVALGVGSLLLAGSLSSLLRRSSARAGLFFLSLWAMGAVLGGIFPPDPRDYQDSAPSFHGLIHGVSAMIAFLAFPVASLRLSKGMTGRSRHLQWLAQLGAISLVIFFACLAPVSSNHAPYAFGLVERVVLGLYVAWLLTAAASVRAQENTKLLS